jgi:hypothetical protein
VIEGGRGWSGGTSDLEAWSKNSHHQPRISSQLRFFSAAHSEHRQESSSSQTLAPWANLQLLPAENRQRCSPRAIVTFSM